MLLLVCLGAYYSFLPAIRAYYKIEDAKLPPISIIGKTLAQQSETPAKFTPVAYHKISPWMIKMIVAAEDQHFFEHHGVDGWGMIRATIANVRAGKMVEGASTLTEQLAKNVFLDWRDKSADRKLKQWAISSDLEGRYNKQQILEAYLNVVYFGRGAYGIGAAAETYFGKTAASLDLAQSAFLAGLVQAPSVFGQPRYLERAIDRQRQLLANAQQYGLIEPDQYDRAIKQALRFR